MRRAVACVVGVASVSGGSLDNVTYWCFAYIVFVVVSAVSDSGVEGFVQSGE